MKSVVKRICDITEKIIIVSGIVLIMSFLVLFTLGIRPYIVVSGSMEPEIMTGSICLMDCNHKKPVIGDIIAYETGNLTVIHRVTDIEPEGYITRGDNNRTDDPGYVSDKNIIGRYICHMENIGYIISLLRSKAGLTVICCLIAVLILEKTIFVKNNHNFPNQQ